MKRLLRWCAGVVFVVDRVLLVVAIVVGSAAVAHQQGQQEQAATGAARGNFGSNFTGTITVGQTTDMRSSRIRFEAGARTNWHIHSAAQLLLVEEGRGRLQELGSEVRELLPGQPVLTKPNVLHWHGAAPDQPALQFSVYTGTLDWKQPVTDDEYLGKKTRTQ